MSFLNIKFNALLTMFCSKIIFFDFIFYYIYNQTKYLLLYFIYYFICLGFKIPIVSP